MDLQIAHEHNSCPFPYQILNEVRQVSDFAFPVEPLIIRPVTESDYDFVRKHLDHDDSRICGLTFDLANSTLIAYSFDSSIYKYLEKSIFQLHHLLNIWARQIIPRSRVALSGQSTFNLYENNRLSSKGNQPFQAFEVIIPNSRSALYPSIVVEVGSRDEVTARAFRWLTQSRSSVGAVIVFRFRVPTVADLSGDITLWRASMIVYERDAVGCDMVQYGPTVDVLTAQSPISLKLHPRHLFPQSILPSDPLITRRTFALQRLALDLARAIRTIGEQNDRRNGMVRKIRGAVGARVGQDELGSLGGDNAETGVARVPDEDSDEDELLSLSEDGWEMELARYGDRGIYKPRSPRR